MGQQLAQGVEQRHEVAVPLAATCPMVTNSRLSVSNIVHTCILIAVDTAMGASTEALPVPQRAYPVHSPSNRSLPRYPCALDAPHHPFFAHVQQQRNLPPAHGRSGAPGRRLPLSTPSRSHRNIHHHARCIGADKKRRTLAPTSTSVSSRAFLQLRGGAPGRHPVQRASTCTP